MLSTNHLNTFMCKTRELVSSEKFANVLQRICTIIVESGIQVFLAVLLVINLLGLIRHADQLGHSLEWMASHWVKMLANGVLVTSLEVLVTVYVIIPIAKSIIRTSRIARA